MKSNMNRPLFALQTLTKIQSLVAAGYLCGGGSYLILEFGGHPWLG